MSKQVILRLLTGDLHQGIQVVLSIEFTRENQEILRTEVSGVLPANPHLADTLQRWQSHYHCLGETRIQPQGIYLDRHQESIDACQQLEPEVRSQFNNWLLANSFRAIRDKWLAELMKEEVLILVRTSESSLLQIPWYLWDLVEENPSAEIALNVFNTEPIVLHTRATIRSQVKILAILGNSKGIDIESDRQLLNNFTNAETTFLVEPQRITINDHLWDQEWDILFFAGHSQTEGERGRIYINQTDSLTITELRHALQKAVANGLQLAIFNSCDGLGLALELQQVQLPQVIVMREPVTDRVAQAFLRYFLPAFASGQPLHLAVREARLRLQGLENELPGASWLPIIVQAAITHSLTWQQLEHRLQSSPTNKWWRISLPRVKDISSVAFSRQAGIWGLLTIGIISGISWVLAASFTKRSNITGSLPLPASPTIPIPSRLSKPLPLRESDKIDGLKATSCQDKRKHRSLSSNTRTTMQVINKRSSPVKIYWINYQGENQHYFDLGAGKQRKQKTFVGHPWLITNKQESQDCLGIFFPTSKSEQVILE
jgi:CHAT domain/VHL beta domain